MDKRKKLFLEGLEKFYGIISDAAKYAGVSRTTYYNWIEEDKEFARLCEDQKEVQTDFVEGKLFSNINEGDTTAIIFYLKSKARDRGYGDRLEVDLTRDKDLEKHSEEELLRRLHNLNGILAANGIEKAQ